MSTTVDITKMTPAQQVAYINQLQAERDAAVAKAESRNVVTAKYRDPDQLYPGTDENGKKGNFPGKGTILLHGIRMGKGTPAFYPGEWLKIFAAKPLIEAVMEANKDKIAAQEAARQAAKAAAK